MECKVKNGTITYSHKLKPDETYKINQTKKYFSLHVFKKPIQVIGFTSMCEDLKHILLIDYDDTAKWIVEKDAANIQAIYNLSPFYLFTTKEENKGGIIVGNYHLVCLTKMTAADVFGILEGTNCDSNFKSMPLRTPFKSWVLRTSNKGDRARPKYLTVIGEKENLNNSVSSAHLKLLKSLYNIKHIPYTNKDNLKKIYKDIYETGG